jgi:hypothetical protein
MFGPFLVKWAKIFKFDLKLRDMESTLDKELFQQILQLDEIEKKSVLQMLKVFVKRREDNYGPISIEQYNREIDEAVARVEAGDYYSQEEVDQMSKDW